MSEEMTEPGGSECVEPTGRWEDRLSEHLDGTLPSEVASAVDRHLSACAACRRVREQLVRVRAAARSLPGRGPERDLWPGIREALHGSVVELRTPGGGEPRPRHRVSLSLPQLATAASILLLVGFGGAWGLLGGGAEAPHAPPASAAASASPAPVMPAASPAPPPGTPEELAREIVGLREVLEARRDELSPGTLRTLERNLALIDRAIGEATAALEEDPGNAFLQGYLRRTVERKAEVLRDAGTLLVQREG